MIAAFVTAAEGWLALVVRAAVTVARTCHRTRPAR